MNRFPYCILILFTAALFAKAQSPQTSGAKTTGTGAPPQGIVGVWNADFAKTTLRPDSVAPMTPEGQAKYNANVKLNQDDRVYRHTDPAFLCEPPGVPRVYQNGPYPFEIALGKDRIFMVFENERIWRNVWMDGRPLPKNPDPTWLGYSVGHWEGSDLVIESVGFNEKTWLDPAGHPHSDALHLIERLHRKDYDTLELVVTVDDPKTYTAPWTMRDAFQYEPKWEIGEGFCVPSEIQQFDEHFLQPALKPNLTDTSK